MIPRVEIPEDAVATCPAGSALVYDLTIHHGFVLPLRMLVCGRPDCENETRYLLLRPDNGLGYGICEACIEDFDFWKERDERQPA